MISILFLIPFSFLIIAFAIYVFYWNIKNNQYDDLEGASSRILFDEEEDKSH